MMGFIDSAKVYTPAGSDGGYSVLATTLTSCRLLVTPTVAAFGNGRVEQTAQPRLLWTDDYTFPPVAQIEVAGARYSVIAGTWDALRGPGGAVVYHRVDVVAVP